jgi:hypothetical protein
MPSKSFESGRQQAQAESRASTGICSERQSNQELRDDSLKRDKQEGIETKRNLHSLRALFYRVSTFPPLKGTLFIQRVEFFYGHPLFMAR